MLNVAAVKVDGILAIFGLGHWEIVFIVLVILLLFGARKLPELARGLGRGLRLFRREVKGIQNDVEGGDEDEERKDSQQALPPREDPEKDTNERAG